MKTLLLTLLIALAGISFATDNNNNNYAHNDIQEQAFQAFINKDPSANKLVEKLQKGFIIPIRFCDERDICTSNLQCGFDGVCGTQVIQGLRRCVCY